MISLDFLEKVTCFSCLNDDQLKMVQERAEMAEFSRGEKIFAHGSDATHVWIVVEGDVELRSEAPKGAQPKVEPAVSFMAEANAFGWTCFVPPYKYQLSGYCSSRQCKLIKFDREGLTELFEKDPVIGLEVMFYLMGAVGQQFGQLQDEIAKHRGHEIMSNW
ncbi:MAG: cyclic nucleotide-binding domain-containing protein [Desulfobacterales bacterium]|nr:cyclic nucleotide-binding domain-containing protein [Desulfobacterales bacterium]